MIDACETKVDISHDLAALEYTVKEEEEYFFVLAYETEEHGSTYLHNSVVLTLKLNEITLVII